MRGFGTPHERPKKVQKNIFLGNIEELKASGRAGAMEKMRRDEVAKQKKAIETEMIDTFKKEREPELDEHAQRAHDANEDLIPPETYD